MAREEVIVVGGGAVGLFVASRLAESGLGVLVLEGEERLGAGATGRNANVIHVIQPPPGRSRRRLCVRGNMAYRALEEELGFRVKWMPLLLVAFNTVEEAVGALAQKALSRVLPRGYGARYTPRGSLGPYRDSVPQAARGALVVEGYGVIDPWSLLESLSRRLESLGGWIRTGERVEGLEVRGERVLVRAGGSEYEARLLVNAAGAYSDDLARMTGDSFGIRPYKGVMVSYSGPRLDAILARMPLSPIRATKGGGAIPQLDGSLLLGPSFAPASGKDDYSYTPGEAASVERAHSRLLPEPPGRLRGVKVGIRPTSPGREFIITRSRLTSRVIHLAGIESPGLTAAPAIAEEVEALVPRSLKPGP